MLSYLQITVENVRSISSLERAHQTQIVSSIHFAPSRSSLKIKRRKCLDNFSIFVLVASRFIFWRKHWDSCRWGWNFFVAKNFLSIIVNTSIIPLHKVPLKVLLVSDIFPKSSLLVSAIFPWSEMLVYEDFFFVFSSSNFGWCALYASIKCSQHTSMSIYG